MQDESFIAFLLFRFSRPLNGVLFLVLHRLRLHFQFLMQVNEASQTPHSSKRRRKNSPIQSVHE